LIRPATESDGDGIGAVWDESARAGFGDLLPAGHEYPKADRERFLALLADPSVRILVADDGGDLLGHTAFGANRDPDAEPGVGEVRSFFVHPKAWRRGVGRALMAGALAGLVELGYSRATLWSFADNARANAFYESQGFARDGATRKEEVWALTPEVRYRRTLP
jgi:GNAT superfamily N-acetyltransferase